MKPKTKYLYIWFNIGWEKKIEYQNICTILGLKNELV